MIFICTGGREWADPYLIEQWLLNVQGQFGKPYDRITIRHGAARGADRMVGSLATRYGFTVDPMPADWDSFGKASGFVRNADMLRKGADAVVAFKDRFKWPYKQGGTEQMCDIAKRANLPVQLHSHDQGIVDL